MKRSFIGPLVISLALLGFALGCQTTSTDQAKPIDGFRGNSWGASKEKVKKTEPGKPSVKKKGDDGLDELGYVGKNGGLDCYFSFGFASNQLVRGGYAFIQKHTNKNLFIDDFNQLKSALTEKYGEPSKDKTNWKNNLYQNDPSEWGLAIAMGHLYYLTTWETPETSLDLFLSGDNFEVHLLLLYESTLPAHKELEKKAAEEAKKGVW